jgi:hypothetical protein
MFQSRGCAGISIAFKENVSPNFLTAQTFIESRPKQPTFQSMRANVWLLGSTWLPITIAARLMA